MGSGDGKDEHHDRRGVPGAVEAGASEDGARAAAGAIPIAKDLTTKEDLGDTRTALTHDIADVRAELKQDIADLRAEVKQDIAELRAEVKHDIAGVKQDIADLKSDLKIMKFVYGPAVLLMLAKLVFFP